MRVFAVCIILLALIACSQTQEVAPAVVIAQPAVAVFAPCDASRGLGESCAQACQCKKPLDCVSGVCLRTKLDDQELCSKNAQCNSGYCTQSGRCGGPDGPTANYACRKICSKNYDVNGEHCHTTCMYDGDVENTSARTDFQTPYS